MSSHNIFAAHADAYWQAGYSIIPVKPATKEPAIKNWTGYCDNHPSEKTKQEWLEKYSDCNLGLLLGAKIAGNFRIAAVDIDRNELVKPVNALISPISGKRGKKGITIFVRVNAGEKLKSTTIRGIEGSAGDLLIGGKMTVMPPSVHPDTGIPYEHITQSLLETPFDSLPVLDGRLYGVLTRLCASTNLANIQVGKTTHNPALSLVAELVSANALDEEITSVITAALPDNYSGDTLDELPEMIASARQKGFADSALGDDDDNISSKLLKLCVANGFEFFHDGALPYASVPTRKGSYITYKIGSSALKSKIRHAWYKATTKSVGSNSLNDAIGTIEAEALYEGPNIPVWNRVGEINGDVFIDLVRDDGLVVQIGKSGWNTLYTNKIKFRRVNGALELPTPAQEGDLAALQGILQLDDERFYAVVAFLVSALRPSGPYFGLVIEGEQGSGKSFLAWVIKSLIDPNEADRLSLPQKEQDLAIHAKHFRLLSYDNTSGMKSSISDALCIIATGGGMATRSLYTDEELSVLSASRPFILNGISGFVKRPDLLERSIYLQLETMGVEKRRTEEEMKAEFISKRPAILGALYQLVGGALANLEITPAPVGVRMADAARFISAAEEGLGVQSGTLISIVSGSQETLMIERINEESLTMALRTVLNRGPYEGTVGDLFGAITVDNKIANLPRSTSNLSTTLERLKPSLLKVGISVQMLSRSRAGKKVRIEFVEQSTEKALILSPSMFAPF